MEDQDYGHLADNIAQIFAWDDINLLSMDAHVFLMKYMGFRNEGGYDHMVTKYRGDLERFARALLGTEFTESLEATKEMLQIHFTGLSGEKFKLAYKAGMTIRLSAIKYLSIVRPDIKMPAN